MRSPLERIFHRAYHRVFKGGKMKAEEKEIKARIGIANFERRTYPRFNIDLPIEYYQVNSSQSQGGRAGNISEGGLLIYLPENIDMGQQIRIKLFFSSGSELNTVEILTEV